MVKLSQYFDGIAGTRGDTDIYVLDSGKPGASALVLGGTHGNEPSGYMAAIVLIENAMPTSGKLYVIPFANASTLTHTDYMEGTPRHFTVETAGGLRRFRYGSRATSPADQWPDPTSTCTLRPGRSSPVRKRATSTAPTPAGRTTPSPRRSPMPSPV